MTEVPLWIEIAKALGAPAAAVAGLFLGDRLNQKRHDQTERSNQLQVQQDEQNRREEAVNLSLSKVLEYSYGITTYSGYVIEHNAELPEFDTARYKEKIRPALYENYNWLPEKMKLQIFDIDQVVFHARYDNYMFPHEHHADMNDKFWELTLMIRQHFGLPLPD